MRIFISYVWPDKPLKVELDQHLQSLRREGKVTTWGRDLIIPGMEWRRIAHKELERAGCIIPLISADYLASDELMQGELLPAIARQNAGQAQVLPVLIRAADYSGTPLESLRMLPASGKPVMAWRSRDDAWLEVVKAIRSLLQSRPE